MAGTTPLSPRDQVLDAIRRGYTTVTALADVLDVTDNAVRLHLSALERDGRVARRGLVRSGKPGQPAAEYDLTETGESALSSAYPAAFTALMEALSDRHDARAMRAVLVDAGARVPRGVADPESSLARRAELCAGALRAL